MEITFTTKCSHVLIHRIAQQAHAHLDAQVVLALHVLLARVELGALVHVGAARLAPDAHREHHAHLHHVVVRPLALGQPAQCAHPPAASGRLQKGFGGALPSAFAKNPGLPENVEERQGGQGGGESEKGHSLGRIEVRWEVLVEHLSLSLQKHRTTVLTHSR